MGQSNVDIAALIGSRICHDLISPIGAINNGLELLGMSGNIGDGPEMDLISESVGNASARIRFFRIAFGAAGEQDVGRAEAASILRDVTHGGRITVAYGPLDPQPREMLRMAFLGILCLENAMPYGGRIELTCDAGDWVLSGHADKLNVDGPLWEVLEDPEAGAEIAPAHVQFALLPAYAKEAYRQLVVDIGTRNIDIRF